MVLGQWSAASRPPPAWIRGRRRRAVGLRAAVSDRRARTWEEAQPGDELALGVLVARRALFGTPREALPRAQQSRHDPLIADACARALETTPPTGFDADGVLERDGVRSQRLDIRRAAVEPITLIARWAGAVAGLSGGSTPERLQAAAQDGVINDADAGTLSDAFEVAFELRLRDTTWSSSPKPADDLVEPVGVDEPLARDHLRARVAARPAETASVRLLSPRGAAAARYAAAGRPAGPPWREANWCAIDLELTGLDPRRPR